MYEIKSHITEAAEFEKIRRVEGFQNIAAEFPAYLTDESKFSCQPFDFLFFPKSEAELSAVMGEMARRGIKVTIAGARTGLVGQKHNLVPRLSVLSNVIHGLLGRHSGPRYWMQGLAPAEARAAGMAALTKVGLADLALRRADQLSGGQSQRVAIARALVGKPRFLVADEPCASLDPQAGEEVMALFMSLVKREGVTVLFTSHNVQHALSYGDRILGLQGGRIAINAASSSVTTKEMAQLYG